ncbi:E3 ubiquitin-protein ligase RMA1-like [Phoenix dactylifera]|uniref:E3 ubiquitin-protein ligase RMA n=1 Tax=Phoenix dactylifera TaxID=42345 RepID=A0A8B8ZUC9_PHODC|nr:E3 ubiquitin-protein ligase RMA1-like [Phoenix dactylifera]
MEVEQPAEGCSSEAVQGSQISQESLKRRVLDAGTPRSANGCFDCNICLDFAVDPVVTLCGHLYCWPCIYKWLQQAESASQQRCPVCKATITENTLVPLYGRGRSTKKTHQSHEIPCRPSVQREEIELQSSSISEEQYSDTYPLIRRHRQRRSHLHQHEHQHYPHHSIPGSDPMPPSSPLGTPLGSRMISSTAGGVLRGILVAVLPWVFRNHQGASMYDSSNPYYTSGNGFSPMVRRQEMELERTLHQIWVFLFCCAMLCLLLF